MIKSHAIKLDDKKKSLRDYIPEWLTRNPLTRFLENLKRTASWLPFIWKDRDWDSGCMLDLMVYKAERISKCIKENDIICDEEQEVIHKSIRVFAKLMKRYKDEDWYTDLYKNILARTWGKEVRWEPAKWFHDKEDFAETTSSGMKCYKYMGLSAPKEVIEGDLYSVYIEEKKKVWQQEAKKRQNDLTKALKIFEKYHSEWWD